jgi:hypothetical protein
MIQINFSCDFRNRRKHPFYGLFEQNLGDNLPPSTVVLPTPHPLFSLRKEEETVAMAVSVLNPLETATQRNRRESKRANSTIHTVCARFSGLFCDFIN